MSSWIASARRIKRSAASVTLAALLLVGAAPVGNAQTDAESFRDLATSQDYRIRVAAALSLGKSKSPGARPALEKALGDGEPAVRAAASAALGALGSAAALPALRAALSRETTVSVRAQLESTIGKLGGAGAPAAKPKFLVSLGKIENKSGVGAAEVASAFKTATRSRLALVSGVEVVSEDTDVVQAGKSRNLPALSVDGALMSLAKQQTASGVGYSARVEYLIRRLPDQTLQGTMRGNAQSQADMKEIHGKAELSQLQIDAVAGAIDIALKGASPALEAAVK